MRLTFFLLFAVFTQQLSYAQNARFRDEFTLDTIMIDNALNADLLHRDQVRGCIYRDKYFQAYNDAKQNTISIYIYKLGENDISQVTLYLADSLKMDAKYKLNSLTVNDRYVVAGFQNFAYLFTYRYEGNRLSFDRVLRTEDNFNFYKLSGNTLVCASTYNTTGVADDKKFHMATYNLKDLRLEKEIYPKFDCIKFSHFNPNHWVDVVGDHIVMSNTCNYKIQTFNMNLEPVETVTRTPTGWKAIPIDLVKSVSKLNLSPRAILDTFHIEHMPCMLLVNHKKKTYQYLSYKDLFDHVNLRKSCRKMINEFIQE